jgi:hypothetical protein
MQIKLVLIRLIMSTSNIILSKHDYNLSKFTILKVILYCQGSVLVRLNIVLLWRSIIFPFQMWCLLVKTQYHYEIRCVDLPIY